MAEVSTPQRFVARPGASQQERSRASSLNTILGQMLEVQLIQPLLNLAEVAQSQPFGDKAFNALNAVAAVLDASPTRAGKLLRRRAVKEGRHGEFRPEPDFVIEPAEPGLPTDSRGEFSILQGASENPNIELSGRIRAFEPGTKTPRRAVLTDEPVEFPVDVVLNRDTGKARLNRLGNFNRLGESAVEGNVKKSALSDEFGAGNIRRLVRRIRKLGAEDLSFTRVGGIGGNDELGHVPRQLGLSSNRAAAKGFMESVGNERARLARAASERQQSLREFAEEGPPPQQTPRQSGSLPEDFGARQHLPRTVQTLYGPVNISHARRVVVADEVARRFAGPGASRRDAAYRQVFRMVNAVLSGAGRDTVARHVGQLQDTLDPVTADRVVDVVIQIIHPS